MEQSDHEKPQRRREFNNLNIYRRGPGKHANLLATKYSRQTLNDGE